MTLLNVMTGRGSVLSVPRHDNENGDTAIDDDDTRCMSNLSPLPRSPAPTNPSTEQHDVLAAPCHDDEKDDMAMNDNDARCVSNLSPPLPCSLTSILAPAFDEGNKAETLAAHMCHDTSACLLNRMTWCAGSTMPRQWERQWEDPEQCDRCDDGKHDNHDEDVDAGRTVMAKCVNYSK
jgi:hypothetical protein